MTNTQSAGVSAQRVKSKAPTVAILDYGSGNLRSAQRALDRVGADTTVTTDRDVALEADGLVVPGVGAFAACMEGLREVRGDQIIGRRLAGGRPVLGICVGMQILFERGIEFGIEADGCGEWPGTVERLQADVLPHMGWNTVAAPTDSVLFDGIDEETRFYFVHTYAVQKWQMEPSDIIAPPKLTWANYGGDFLAAVENGPLSATQFHPEKSGDAGAHLLENWVRTL
ncbi:imidazole glycerol phosphate synthase subunit HisH [Hoyosella rhizosphaerae]|uniref:Imidazole glycerol phosphate synthase subunit HisH n=1 Tax=Hoyosella rhizosphaerae TaxID=1755582 RepID=A0A916UEN3_9ACTN|nr:imidazole glycerol phosphate synthase subunit HisH [Hoyosella rhizosphaerae]MBN4925578.1 imidazole glycerol phosphate synthase subunit HisH [Hoyosella rhizosphaerae]GGC69557.1 imidazole glycerol phosphate synthase subunit HisH [Hoyosella rhizosphaerae]